MSETLTLPAGIDDVTTRALLAVLARWDDIPIERVLVWLVDHVVEDALPHIAEQLGVDGPEFESGAPRAFLRKAIDLRRRRGTVGALEEVLTTLGYGEDVVELKEGGDQQTYDGTLTYDGVHTYGSDTHWAIFIVYVDVEAGLSEAEVRKLWDAAWKWRPKTRHPRLVIRQGATETWFRSREEVAEVSELGGGPAPLYGMVFTGGDAYFGSVASGPVAAGRCRFRLDSLPTTAFEIVAGTSNGGTGTGWLVCWEDNYGGSAIGQLVVYVGIGGVLTRIARKFFMPDDVGRVFTVHVVCDGATVFAYLDGHKLNAGTAAAALADGDIMNIGGNAVGGYSSSVTVIDVAEGTTVLTPAEIAADAAALTPAFAGQTHRYVASASVGAAWLDEVGTVDLAQLGAATAESFAPTFGDHRGTVEIWGDSIAAGRQADTNTGDGWARAVERGMSTAGRAITIIGKSPTTAPTYDWDYYTSATGGEALNSRLATLATDLATYGPADCATVLAYGINDIVALGRSAAQLQADVTTAVGLINTARPGRPIVVANIMTVAAGSASGPQHAEIDSYIAAFPSFITTLRGTYSNVLGVDYSGVVTDPEDTAILFDGTHPTPTTDAAIATTVISSLVAAM